VAKTIPNKARKSWPRGTFQDVCDYCSARYMRHQLVRKEGGLLACTGPNGCAKGRDETQLSRMNAEHAAQVYKHSPQDGGRADTNNLPVIHRTTAADILLYDQAPPFEG
jgi:hypothetical protein